MKNRFTTHCAHFNPICLVVLVTCFTWACDDKTAETEAQSADDEIRSSADTTTSQRAIPRTEPRHEAPMESAERNNDEPGDRQLEADEPTVNEPDAVDLEDSRGSGEPPNANSSANEPNPLMGTESSPSSESDAERDGELEGEGTTSEAMPRTDEETNQGSDSNDSIPQPPPEPDPPSAQPVDLETTEGFNVGLFAPNEEPEPPSRPRRRMNVDQLNASMMAASGGIAWTERRNNRDVNLFETLSATLGKPNYTTITNEDLEPSALFQKFLGDAARSVCAQMLERDLSGEHGLVLLPVDNRAEAIDEHLQYLIGRFHSRMLSSDSRDLAQWRWLYDSSWFVTRDANSAWNSVCVALFIHPDFYTY